MTDKGFLRISNEAFVPFLKELGFAMHEPHISGRFYLVTFTNSTHTVSVCYEPGDDYLCVRVSARVNPSLSEFDNLEITPRLSDLNRRYQFSVTLEERAHNEALFDSISAHDDEERLLLKAAKELRVVLPRYLAS